MANKGMVWQRVGLLAGLLVVVALVTAAGAKKKPLYVGVKKCKKCHSKAKLGGEEYQAWKKTAHATAIDTLKPGHAVEAKKAAKLDPQHDYSKEAYCLKCHTTGWGKAAKAKAVLTNVQCEACHGPGSLYRKTSIMSKKKWRADRKAMRAKARKAGLKKPNEKDCRTCHNEESPMFKKFVFAKMKEKIKHRDDK